GSALPARCLVADQAVLTAIGNDVGYELTFSRQLIAFAASPDIAMGFSTSGNSENVIRAFEEARSRNVLTIGFAGYEGGQMAACEALEHCFIVRSHSVHRIQETQAALSYRLWEVVQEHLVPDGVGLAAQHEQLEPEVAR
ncbi:MAG TPA: SIS domain-containing protein, partial [Acidimicrobiales bacterium]|nr:SIS domain-containing protein [Acidimicrobiales bacterium]